MSRLDPPPATPNVMLVYGTRPEAIKMAPLVKALERSVSLNPIVVVTGQHREMLDQVNELFDIRPKHDLNVIQPRQTLPQLSVRALDGLSGLMAEERPDAVVVQGDTTTSFVAALAAFYERVPVVHVEAGLRTHNRYSPYPEEINRRLTSQVTNLHLAPTSTAKANLLREGIDAWDVVVTGNSVIDALLEVVGRKVPFGDRRLEALDGKPIVLITSHRRESWGEPMARVAEAIAILAMRFPNVHFVLPAHKNPVVRDVLLPPLQGHDNVVITEPLAYGEFARLMQCSRLILTDSGGVQEEAPSLGKPVLVMRESTERPEAVAAGTVRLVGTDRDTVVDSVASLLEDEQAYDRMANAVNPYGDGQASRRSVQAIERYFGLSDVRIDEFDPMSSRL
jgi:UDP-N-acetylglucosamine 2-epimerase (non-hydrolysing)